MKPRRHCPFNGGTVYTAFRCSIRASSACRNSPWEPQKYETQCAPGPLCHGSVGSGTPVFPHRQCLIPRPSRAPGLGKSVAAYVTRTAALSHPRPLAGSAYPCERHHLCPRPLEPPKSGYRNTCVKYRGAALGPAVRISFWELHRRLCQSQSPAA